MIYFKTRSAARAFAKGKKTIIDMMAKDAKLVDVFRVSAGITKRWGVKVI